MFYCTMYLYVRTYLSPITTNHSDHHQCKYKLKVYYYTLICEGNVLSFLLMLVLLPDRVMSDLVWTGSFLTRYGSFLAWVSSLLARAASFPAWTGSVLSVFNSGSLKESSIFSCIQDDIHSMAGYSRREITNCWPVQQGTFDVSVSYAGLVTPWD